MFLKINLKVDRIRYNPNKLGCHSIRLKEFDYSQNIAYFIIICQKIVFVILWQYGRDHLL